jgi:hypothetical protein
MAKRKSKTTPGANMLRPTDELSAEQEKMLLEMRKEDGELAMDFLVGVVEYNDKGLPRWEPLKGADETKARKALIRLLRCQELTPAICVALAILFGDEIEGSDLALRQYPLSNPTWARYRKLVFKKRLGGAPPKGFERSAIAGSVWRDIARGTKPETAKRRAAEKFNLSEPAIKSILRDFRALKNAIIKDERGE